MQNNDQILEAIEHYLGQIGYPEEPGRLYAPISYSLTMTGKRLRPMLLMLTCGIFSDQPQAAMPAAAAVEVFHNFTLLHIYQLIKTSNYGYRLYCGRSGTVLQTQIQEAA